MPIQLATTTTSTVSLLLATVGLSIPAGNGILGYGAVVATFLILLLVMRGFQWLVRRQLTRIAQRTATDLDDVFVKLVDSVRPTSLTYIALYIALQLLVLPPWAHMTLTAVLLIVLVYQVVRAAGIVIEFFAARRFAKTRSADGTVDPQTKSAIELVGTIVRASLWVVGGILILSNLGVEVTSLIAGLGIGGLAIGLALQAVLGDLFSSFAIYFDKPFVVGDFIIVGDVMGTVEHVGIKTTRIRALGGQQIVVGNSDLTSSRINNYKKMQERRIVFSFGIRYETPRAQVAAVPQIVQRVIEGAGKTRFDRAHFAAFGDSALSFEVVYYVRSPDYNEYMDIQQAINLGLLNEFADQHIEFAYPTQTLYVANTNA